VITQAAGAAAGVGLAVLVWAVHVRLTAVVRCLRHRYTPRPVHATFDPAGAYLVVIADCDRCVRYTAHEDDQAGTATCVACGTARDSREAADA
jgi:hypothetical protein